MPNRTPSLPRLVLRVGFAGNRELPRNLERLSGILSNVFDTIARRIAEIAPGTAIQASEPESRIRRFYSNERPLVRLVTGLCEGADSLAFNTLEGLQAKAALLDKVAVEMAAVVPFDLPDYRSSRPEEFRPEFDRQAALCAYILCLDGHYEKPDPDTALARERRARAYRAQAALLLRHSDLLVAIADSSEAGKAGGAIETVRAALDFDLPVVFIDSGSGQVRLIRPGDNVASTLAMLQAGSPDWANTLRGWVTNIVADPDADLLESSHESGPSHGDKLLEEFLYGNATSAQLSAGNRGQRTRSFREKCWALVDNAFRPSFAPWRDPSVEPYAAWRARATNLNYHYSGLYRGAFLLNYVMAACAVSLAALSLVLLGSAAGETVFPVWLLISLVGLGSIKLCIVVWIFLNTRQANDGDWNDRAVDYRYLAERLRALFYLSRIGSFQPPAAAPPQYASRVVRQSAVDWLLDAIVRSVSPASLDFARKETFRCDNRELTATIIRLNPVSVLADVRDRWVREQAIYHDRNARTMDRLHGFAENWGKVFNVAVIGFVLLDVLILLADYTGLLSEKYFHVLHAATPWLVFLAAVLPAAVASLNGIRFQSECRRLGERSAVARAILRGRDRSSKEHHARRGWQRWPAFVKTLYPNTFKNKSEVSPEPSGGKWAEANSLAQSIAGAQSDPAADLGSWTHEVLSLSESVARFFVQEVAEWSVLYAKEVPEP